MGKKKEKVIEASNTRTMYMVCKLIRDWELDSPNISIPFPMKVVFEGDDLAGVVPVYKTKEAAIIASKQFPNTQIIPVEIPE